MNLWGERREKDANKRITGFEGGGGNFVANPQVQLPAPFKAGYAYRSAASVRAEKLIYTIAERPRETPDKSGWR